MPGLLRLRPGHSAGLRRMEDPHTWHVRKLHVLRSFQDHRRIARIQNYRSLAGESGASRAPELSGIAEIDQQVAIAARAAVRLSISSEPFLAAQESRGASKGSLVSAAVIISRLAIIASRHQ